MIRVDGVVPFDSFIYRRVHHTHPKPLVDMQG